MYNNNNNSITHSSLHIKSLICCIHRYWQHKRIRNEIESWSIPFTQFTRLTQKIKTRKGNNNNIYLYNNNNNKGYIIITKSNNKHNDILLLTYQIELFE